MFSRWKKLFSLCIFTCVEFHTSVSMKVLDMDIPSKVVNVVNAHVRARIATTVRLPDKLIRYKLLCDPRDWLVRPVTARWMTVKPIPAWHPLIPLSILTLKRVRDFGGFQLCTRTRTPYKRIDCEAKERPDNYFHVCRLKCCQQLRETRNVNELEREREREKKPYQLFMIVHELFCVAA